MIAAIGRFDSAATGRRSRGLWQKRREPMVDKIFDRPAHGNGLAFESLERWRADVTEWNDAPLLARAAVLPKEPLKRPTQFGARHHWQWRS